MANYKIYPTLLDSYLWYKRSEADGELDKLINKINRVAEPSTPEMIKGTEFKRVLDDMTMAYDNPAEMVVVEGHEFSAALLNSMWQITNGGMNEVFLAREIETRYGTVELYGYADCVKQDRIIEVKTTRSYDWGKYAHNMQRYVYPYLLDATNDMWFNYLVTDFRSIFTENYQVRRKEWDAHLVSILNDFISFINLPDITGRITDTKIYGQ